MDRPRAHHNGKSDFNQARGSGLYPDLFCKGSGPFASVRAALQIAGRASPIIESASVLEEVLDIALNLMDSEERQLLELFYFDRLSQKEIAERLDTTPKAIS